MAQEILVRLIVDDSQLEQTEKDIKKLGGSIEKVEKTSKKAGSSLKIHLMMLVNLLIT